MEKTKTPNRLGASYLQSWKYFKPNARYADAVISPLLFVCRMCACPHQNI